MFWEGLASSFRFHSSRARSILARSIGASGQRRPLICPRFHRWGKQKTAHRKQARASNCDVLCLNGAPSVLCRLATLGSSRNVPSQLRPETNTGIRGPSVSNLFGKFHTEETPSQQHHDRAATSPKITHPPFFSNTTPVHNGQSSICLPRPKSAPADPVFPIHTAAMGRSSLLLNRGAAASSPYEAQG